MEGCVKSECGNPSIVWLFQQFDYYTPKICSPKNTGALVFWRKAFVVSSKILKPHASPKGSNKQLRIARLNHNRSKSFTPLKSNSWNLKITLK